MDKKYSIFHIEGGLGKHVAATAVCKCIKNNYPDRELIVVCAWPEVFVNLSFVDRVYKIGMTPYFYQDYVNNIDSLIFKHEPYFTTNHIHKKTRLIQNWCELYGLNYEGEQPELVYNIRQKQLAYSSWGSEKPLMLIQTNGGMFETNNSMSYRWTRDMPPNVLDEVVEFYKSGYTIVQIGRENSYFNKNAIPFSKKIPSMELFSALLLSKKRLFIDSSMQHAAAAMGLKSTVLWIGTSPDVFGYDVHDNIKVNEYDQSFKLPDSYLFDFNFEGIIHECPYKDFKDMFNVNEIIDSLKKQ